VKTTLVLLSLSAAALISGARAADATSSPAPSPAPAASAAPANPAEPGKPHRDRADALSKELGLTPEQQEKFKAAVGEQKEALKALREDKSLSRPDKKAKLQDLEKSFDAKMATILTPEQKQKFDAKRQEMREKMEARRAEKAGKGDQAPAAQPSASPVATP